jgi:NADPH:quinone reductase-like Zn-dependent oxidoreductase
MRAYQLESFDGPPRMVEVPKPVVSDGELLVRVHAVSVNPVDLGIASGDAKSWLEYRFPVTLGRDLAGTVEEVGAGVTKYAVGDRVFGYVAGEYAHDGSFAEYITVPEGEFLVHAPGNVDHIHAAALGLAAVTASMCLDAAGVSEGTSVLVNGASGGVGGYAVQMAHARGARVVASARPGEEERHVLSLGADAAIDWSGPNFAEAARATQTAGFDTMVDVVTADPGAFAALARTVLAAEGIAVSTVGAADPDRLGGINATNVWSSPDVSILRRIAALAADGQLHAPLGETYDFDAIGAAFDAVRNGAVGKIGVTLVP